ncbi:MAG: hypothetical protein D9V45_12890 [Chloroflexi bacterium]|nr:MAG: hypothetical protein D9V45_12890 [Chloroflexota bacterium]
MPALVDIFLAAEGALERELCGIAILRPQEFAKSDIRPEVNLAAIAFFKKFDELKDDILAADELAAITLAHACAGDDFWKFWSELYGVNSAEESQTIGSNIIALRTVRKAVSWVEESGVLARGKHGG